MKNINIDGLLALNLEEIEIVYRRCRGHSVQKIAGDMGMVASTIWNVRIPRICKILGVEEWKDASEELCIPLRSIVPDLKALKESWPEAFREKIEALRETVDAIPEPFPTQPKPIAEELPNSQTASTPLEPEQITPESLERTRRPTRIPPWPVFAIPLLLLCVGFVALVWIGRHRLQDILVPGPEETAAVTEPSINLPEPTETIETSAGALVTPSPIVVTEPQTEVASLTPTDIPPPTDTPVPLPTDTPIPLPTDALTPLPTDTPAPTFSPVISPTNNPWGFEDQFSDGVSEDWDVLSGEPLILDRQFLMSRGSELSLAYGDPLWTDYEVEVGVDTATCGIRGNYIFVRMTDIHQIAFVFSGCGGSFWEYDGEWRRIDATIYEVGSLQGETVRVVVRGNEVIGYVKGVAVTSITTSFPNGRVGLKIQEGSKITFFRVRELQP